MDELHATRVAEQRRKTPTERAADLTAILRFADTAQMRRRDKQEESVNATWLKLKGLA
jgi:hypothetical protein